MSASRPLGAELAGHGDVWMTCSCRVVGIDRVAGQPSGWPHGRGHCLDRLRAPDTSDVPDGAEAMDRIFPEGLMTRVVTYRRAAGHIREPDTARELGRGGRIRTGGLFVP